MLSNFPVDVACCFCARFVLSFSLNADLQGLLSALAGGDWASHSDQTETKRSLALRARQARAAKDLEHKAGHSAGQVPIWCGFISSYRPKCLPTLAHTHTYIIIHHVHHVHHLHVYTYMWV